MNDLNMLLSCFRTKMSAARDREMINISTFSRQMRPRDKVKFGGTKEALFVYNEPPLPLEDVRRKKHLVRLIFFVCHPSVITKHTARRV